MIKWVYLKYVILPAIVVFQPIKIGVRYERILSMCLNEKGVPVETVAPGFRHTDNTSVRLPVSTVTVAGLCATHL